MTELRISFVAEVVLLFSNAVRCDVLSDVMWKGSIPVKMGNITEVHTSYVYFLKTWVSVFLLLDIYSRINGSEHIMNVFLAFWVH